MQKEAHGAENGVLDAEKTGKEGRSAEGGAWHKNEVRCKRRRTVQKTVRVTQKDKAYGAEDGGV